jgi:hypothetical protein
VVVQAVVASSLEFLWSSGPSPGACHDNSVFESTPFCERLDAFVLAPYVLLADSAFAARKNVIPMFKDAALDAPEHLLFIRLHILLRNCVERAFGVFKSRFRAFAEATLDVDVLSLDVVIKATMLLHNRLLREREGRARMGMHPLWTPPAAALEPDLRGLPARKVLRGIRAVLNVEGVIADALARSLNQLRRDELLQLSDTLARCRDGNDARLVFVRFFGAKQALFE